MGWGGRSGWQAGSKGPDHYWKEDRAVPSVGKPAQSKAGRQAQLAPRLQASRRWDPVSFGTPLHSCKAEASKILELRTD